MIYHEVNSTYTDDTSIAAWWAVRYTILRKCLIFKIKEWIVFLLLDRLRQGSIFNYYSKNIYLWYKYIRQRVHFVQLPKIKFPFLYTPKNR